MGATARYRPRSSAVTRCFTYEDDRLRAELALRSRHPALRGPVAAWWGFSEHGLDPLIRRHVPGATALLFIGFGPTPSLARADGTQRFQRPPQALLAGPDASALLSRSVPGMRFMMVELSPLAAFSLLGGPLREVHGTWVPLGALGERHLRWLPEQLAEARGWPERFDLVEDALRSALAAGPRPDAVVVGAWHRLTEAGPVGVQRLADDLGYSRRHLSRRFHEVVGLPPRTAARLLRLRRALARMRDRGAGNLAETAAACGYADQAHLNREFRSLVGTTPTRFLTEARSVRRGSAGYTGEERLVTSGRVVYRPALEAAAG